MKKIIFIAHDPGGYDVIQPVYQKMLESRPCIFWAVGPAADLAEDTAVSTDGVLTALNQVVKMNTVAALVTGTSWGSRIELDCISLCKQAGIITISILDYWSNYAERFKTENATFIYPDYYFVMDDLARREAINAGVPEKILRIVGHPGLDKFCHGLTSDKLKSIKKIQRVLFLSQPLSILYGGSLGYTEQTALLDVIRWCKERKLQLAVKFHPKDDKDFREKYVDISISGNVDELMLHYDLVIGMSTMALLHAALEGVSILSYQPNLRVDDGCITNKLGLSQRINSYKELRDMSLYKQKSSFKKRGIHSYLWLDGCSTERVVGEIEYIMRERMG